MKGRGERGGTTQAERIDTETIPIRHPRALATANTIRHGDPQSRTPRAANPLIMDASRSDGAGGEVCPE